MSPNVWEYAAGVSRQFGGRATLRADCIYRNYRDFYADLTTPGSRAQDAEGAPTISSSLATTTISPFRSTPALTASGTFRWTALDIGGNYTLSRNWGNFEGETVANGPVRFEGPRFPEYKQESLELS